MIRDDDRAGFPDPADPITRVAAKIVDVVLVLALSRLAPPWGIALGLAYLLLCDALPGAQSAGKRLLGLRVVQPPRGLPATVAQSALRNADLALIYILLFIPLLGLVLAAVLGPFVLAVEIYAVFRDPHGLRMGDVFAGTEVVGPAPLKLNQRLEPDAP